MEEASVHKTTIPRRYVPEALLVLVTLLWGTTFILTKQTTQSIPPVLYLVLRFAVSLVAMLPFLIRHGKFFTIWKNWKISLIAGSLYFISIITQTIGLQFTSASKGAFITSLGVIFVPLFISIFHRRKIHYLLWIAVIIAIIGVGFLSFSKIEPISWGDPLILICAVAYALYVIYLDHHVHEVEIVPFTAVQLFEISFLSLLVSVVVEWGIFKIIPPLTTVFTIQNIAIILYLGVIATTITFILQSYGQRFVSSTRASLIFAFEPFFATLFAIWIGDERLRIVTGIGMILIFSAVLISIFSPQDPMKIAQIRAEKKDDDAN